MMQQKTWPSSRGLAISVGPQRMCGISILSDVLVRGTFEPTSDCYEARARERDDDWFARPNPPPPCLPNTVCMCCEVAACFERRPSRLHPAMHLRILFTETRERVCWRCRHLSISNDPRRHCLCCKYVRAVWEPPALSQSEGTIFVIKSAREQVCEPNLFQACRPNFNVGPKTRWATTRGPALPHNVHHTNITPKLVCPAD
jgi:hypothetical protein